MEAGTPQDTAVPPALKVVSPALISPKEHELPIPPSDGLLSEAPPSNRLPPFPPAGLPPDALPPDGLPPFPPEEVPPEALPPDGLPLFPPEELPPAALPPDALPPPPPEVGCELFEHDAPIAHQPSTMMAASLVFILNPFLITAAPEGRENSER